MCVVGWHCVFNAAQTNSFSEKLIFFAFTWWWAQIQQIGVYVWVCTHKMGERRKSTIVSWFPWHELEFAVSSKTHKWIFFTNRDSSFRWENSNLKLPRKNFKSKGYHGCCRLVVIVLTMVMFDHKNTTPPTREPTDSSLLSMLMTEVRTNVQHFSASFTITKTMIAQQQHRIRRHFWHGRRGCLWCCCRLWVAYAVSGSFIPPPKPTKERKEFPCLDQCESIFWWMTFLVTPAQRRAALSLTLNGRLGADRFRKFHVPCIVFLDFAGLMQLATQKWCTMDRIQKRADAVQENSFEILNSRF